MGDACDLHPGDDDATFDSDLDTLNDYDEIRVYYTDPLLPDTDGDTIDDADDFEVLAKWTTRAHGGWGRNLSRKRLVAVIDHEKSMPARLEEQKRIEGLLRGEVLRLDLRETIRRIRTPLLCIVGRDDVDVPWEVVRDEIAGYAGPVAFRLFDHSHHMPFIDEEALFVETVTRFLEGDEAP